MHKGLSQNQTKSLFDDAKTYGRIELALKRSKQLDQTANMDQASQSFDFKLCKDQPWNPENFSLLWGTWLWNNSTPAQKTFLNQMYWIAYYSQIISAEVATIFF